MANYILNILYPDITACEHHVCLDILAADERLAMVEHT